FKAKDGIRDRNVTGVQTCALPISLDDFIDRTISSKSYLFKISICLFALATMALAKDPPHSSSNPFSREPPFTPILIGIFFSRAKIGRASCRERGEIEVGGVRGMLT